MARSSPFWHFRRQKERPLNFPECTIYHWSLGLCRGHSDPISAEWKEHDWEALLRFSKTHGLSGWVLSRLEGDIPPFARRALEDQQNEARIRGMVLLQGARKAREILASAGVTEVAPLKGLYLLSELYGDWGARVTNDVDFLISPRDREASHSALIESGMRYLPKPPGRPVSQRENYERSYQSPDGYLVDVHTSMAPPHRVPMDTDQWLERGVVLDTGPLEGFLELDETDTFLSLAIHMGQDNLQGPFRQWVDLAQWIRMHSLDSSNLLQRGKENGCERLVWLVLERLRHLQVLPSAGFERFQEPSPRIGAYFRKWLHEDRWTAVPSDYSLRWAQLLIALPAMDSPLQATQWAVDYLRLRALDWTTNIRAPRESVGEGKQGKESNG